MSKKNSRIFKITILLCAVVTCAAVVVLPERKLSGVQLFPGLQTELTPSSSGEENLSEVPLYQQPTNETCGEAAFLMAWNYTHQNKLLNLDKVISTATQKGWYVNPDPAGVYTSPAHMSDMANYYA